MFTRQPAHVVKRSDVIVFHGTRSECEKFRDWANREFGTSEYRSEAWK